MFFFYKFFVKLNIKALLNKLNYIIINHFYFWFFKIFIFKFKILSKLEK